MSIPIGRGPIITGVIAIIGMSVVVWTFVNFSSASGTFADARRTGDQAIHVAGDIRKGSLDNEPLQHVVRFTLKDESGESMPVVYTGDAPTDLSLATHVVAIGGIKNGAFVADRLLVKCPSKYQDASEQTPAPRS
jgi:cytochrome c-type biogenesis protein CcmE